MHVREGVMKAVASLPVVTIITAKSRMFSLRWHRWSFGASFWRSSIPLCRRNGSILCDEAVKDNT